MPLNSLLSFPVSSYPSTVSLLSRSPSCLAVVSIEEIDHNTLSCEYKLYMYDNICTISIHAHTTHYISTHLLVMFEGKLLTHARHLYKGV